MLGMRLLMIFHLGFLGEDLKSGNACLYLFIDLFHLRLRLFNLLHELEDLILPCN